MSSGSVEEVDVSAPVGRQVLEEPLSDSARACVGHVSPADDSAVLLEADADAGLQEDGVELEQDDPDGAAAEHPFDPSKIKVRTISVVVDQLVKRVEFKEIDLAPDFQRLKGIWKARDKSRLIESLLLRIPIPVFYVSADKDDHWSVVDGVQRISTITDFIAGAFPVTDLEYRDDLNGRRYADLPRSLQRRINETQLAINVIEPGTPADVMFNIFRRINTGGEPLRAQEIRHALYGGPVRDFLKTLASSEDFKRATGGINPRRMADRECVLRFLAFHLDRWEDYQAASLDGYLGTTMQKLNRADSERLGQLTADFRKAMRAATEIFGGNAFRKMYSSVPRKYPLSKQLFEAWSVAFARCNDDEVDRLIASRDLVKENFMSLRRSDSGFEAAISYGTGKIPRVRKRFGAIQNLVQEVLRCSNASD